MGTYHFQLLECRTPPHLAQFETLVLIFVNVETQVASIGLKYHISYASPPHTKDIALSSLRYETNIGKC